MPPNRLVVHPPLSQRDHGGIDGLGGRACYQVDSIGLCEVLQIPADWHARQGVYQRIPRLRGDPMDTLNLPHRISALMQPTMPAISA